MTGHRLLSLGFPQTFSLLWLSIAAIAGKTSTLILNHKGNKSFFPHLLQKATDPFHHFCIEDLWLHANDVEQYQCKASDSQLLYDYTKEWIVAVCIMALLMQPIGRDLTRVRDPAIDGEHYLENCDIRISDQ